MSVDKGTPVEKCTAVDKNTSIESLITDHIDIWTSTIKRKSATGRGSSKKRELYGIKKLRELILELAVRGKLVPQDANDEPASVLLERIAEEKAQLVKDGKIKEPKKLPEILEDEKPFKQPETWIIKRFGDVLFNRDGERRPVSAEERKGMQGQYDYYGASGVIDKVNGFIFDKTLLLIGEDGANLISRSTPIAFLAHGKYWVNNHAHVLDGISVIFLEFIALHINAISLEAYITGTAQPKMNQAKMNSIVLAIPPEPEQRRIVAKVDELMALCDELEAQTESSLDAHQTLVSVLLDTLVNSQDADELAENWTRLSDHFDTLFTTEHSIDQLKQTVLQLAVMGKLVPQDPNDEPASVLLERIAAEKAQLIKDKKYQKSSKLKSKDKTINYPQGWECVQTGEVCPSIVPNRDRPKTFTGKIPWVTLPAFPNNSLYLDHSKVELNLSKSEVSQYSARLIPERSVLMSCVGRFGLTAINLEPVTSNQQVHAFIALKGLLPEFLSTVIKVEGKALESVATSTTIAYLNKTNCESIQFGLPPTEEQHRIVAKVDELMTLCDQLKTRLNDAQTTQRQLADALTEQAL